MSIMCKCGCENSDSALHCENCGEKLGVQQKEYAPYQNNPYQNTPYGGQQSYYPSQQYYGQSEQPVSIGAWVGLLFLFSIPIVNIITYIVILCSSQNKTLKNLVLAQFIVIGIGVVLAFLCILIPALIGYSSRYGIMML
ncbi:MAG: hypothetical protein IJ305_08565 [Oscillospiraceae bacterium]|nr:hypothetical protein [Oscillospiraceae bacterium]